MPSGIVKDRKAMTPAQRREAAKSDARVLAEAEVIRKDYSRHADAVTIAEEMLQDEKENIEALAEIATSALNYPSLEKQQKKKDLLR